MTFAYHLPHATAGSSAVESPADYASGKSMVQVWGLPANVARGVDVHNEVVQEIVLKNAGMLFVDQHRLMPRDREHFHDCCHLTKKGCAVLVRNIVDGVGTRLASQVETRAVE